MHACIFVTTAKHSENRSVVTPAMRKRVSCKDPHETNERNDNCGREGRGEIAHCMREGK